MAKLSLREFQEELARKLADTATRTSARALLGLQAGSESWLIDLAESGEILPVPALTPVPLTIDWMRGVANVRGVLYAVSDFSAFQGGPPTPLNADARLLLPHAKFNCNCALLVSRVLGLRALEDFEPAEAAADPRPWVSAQFSDTQGRRWRRLDPRRLYAGERFLDVGA
ncbi:chemotaxis protein CheW [Methyloversatilis sp.]|uniref:chemotaxis protein CheW n=1 Tax=Methyloversatilis sp. TaxID=2569862 RepID=UPI0035B1ECC0